MEGLHIEVGGGLKTEVGAQHSRAPLTLNIAFDTNVTSQCCHDCNEDSSDCNLLSHPVATNNPSSRPTAS